MRIAIGAVTMLAILTGCALLPPAIDSNARATSEINAYLREFEAEESADLPLDSIVSGDWTRVVIACFGVTSDQVNDQLGFRWSTSDGFDNSTTFIAMLIFATDSEVVSYLNVGQNDQFENWYFTPCTPTGHGGEVGESPIELARSDSSIRVEFDSLVDEWPYWFVSASEFDQLRLRQL